MVCYMTLQVRQLWRDAHLARSKFTAENFPPLVAKVASCQGMDIVHQVEDLTAYGDFLLDI